MGLSITNTGGARVHAAIASAAAVTGVDFAYLLNQAKVESGFNPDARARTSSATGLYQFIEQSWLGTVKAHGAAHGLGWAASAIERGSDGRYHVDPSVRQTILDLRRDPEAASTMAAEFAGDNRAHLEGKLGRQVESVDLYLAHFLGAGGATTFLRNMDAAPDQPAAALFPAAAHANRGVFYDRDGGARSLAEVRERFAAKFQNSSAPLPAFREGLGVGTSFAERKNPPLTPPGRPGGERQRPNANVRLAYLMLASLGV